jgi:hypothetical protein
LTKGAGRIAGALIFSCVSQEIQGVAGPGIEPGTP